MARYFSSTQFPKGQCLDIFSTYTHDNGDLIQSYNLNNMFMLKFPNLYLYPDFSL